MPAVGGRICRACESEVEEETMKGVNSARRLFREKKERKKETRRFRWISQLAYLSTLARKHVLSRRVTPFSRLDRTGSSSFDEEKCYLKKKKEERKLIIIIIIKKIKKRRSKSTYDKLWCTIYVIREILSCYWKLQLRVTLPVNQISRATRIGGWFYAGERSLNGIHLMEKKKNI